MFKYGIFISMFMVASCTAFTWLVGGNQPHARKLASEGPRLSSSIDYHEKLQALHSYYVIAQKSRFSFDEMISNSPLKSLYESESYKAIQSARSQINEIQRLLIDSKEEALKELILNFAISGNAQAASMKNLAEALDIDDKIFDRPILRAEIEQEYRTLKDRQDFLVYETNVGHLSHVLKIKMSMNGDTSRITGNEFPSKVWSLTFDSGPRLEVTPKILEALDKRKLKATFFQLTRLAKSSAALASDVKSAGMEIGSHGFGHKEISVDPENEISGAVNVLDLLLDLKVRFFRLDATTKDDSQNIRDELDKNNLLTVYWNVDSLDWLPQGPGEIVVRTKRLMAKTKKDSGVILFHDVYKRTIEASEKIMDHLKIEGRRVCTLNDILTQMKKGDVTVCPQN